MHIERGSTWNKWDFHVHTPYSILNNQFGFNPDPDGRKDVSEFDNYVKTLFTKAVEKEIVAIGITDFPLYSNNLLSLGSIKHLIPRYR